MKQLPLLRGSHLPPLLRYDLLWNHLPSLPAPSEGRSSRGRKGYDDNSLLRALVVRCLTTLPTLVALVDTLNMNPSLVECLGMNPLLGSPPVERFSSFLRDTPNATFQEVRRPGARLIRRCHPGKRPGHRFGHRPGAGKQPRPTCFTLL
jgi:hypothetical protein